MFFSKGKLLLEKIKRFCKSRKLCKKDLLAAITLTLLVVSVPVTLALVKQRQEIRKHAYSIPGSCCACEKKADSLGECNLHAPSCRALCPTDSPTLPPATSQPTGTPIPAGSRPPGCPVGCCGGECGGCPAGQACDIPNGACTGAGSSKSCNPAGYGYHKACHDKMCVEVPGAGSDECQDNVKCQQSQSSVCTPNECCGDKVRCNSAGTACNVTDAIGLRCGADRACWPGNCCKEGYKCNSAGSACDVRDSRCTSTPPTATLPPKATATPTIGAECATPEDCEAPGRCNVACTGLPRKCRWTPCAIPTPTIGMECATPEDCEAPGRCNVACTGSPRRCHWTPCPTGGLGPTPTLSESQIADCMVIFASYSYEDRLIICGLATPTPRMITVAPTPAEAVPVFTGLQNLSDNLAGGLQKLSDNSLTGLQNLSDNLLFGLQNLSDYIFKALNQGGSLLEYIFGGGRGGGGGGGEGGVR